MENLENLRYPIGHFNCPKEISKADIAEWINALETLPERLELLVKDFSHKQLETPYRPEGWTVRQVIHHIADSHHHSYTRFKWALPKMNRSLKPMRKRIGANFLMPELLP